MKKFLVLTFLLLVLAFPSSSLASSATSVVETQVEGEAEVYQYVETTVDGQTVKKESSQPGKLELKMEKTGQNEPTVTFSQESATPPQTLPETKSSLLSIIAPIIDFVRKLLSNLTSFLK